VPKKENSLNSSRVNWIKAMNIEKDLNVLERNAKIREDQNWRFRSYLKGSDDPDEIDRIVHELNDKVTSEIDCTECANCL